MKHYIYIDKEILNSYISQIYGGILEKEKSEKEIAGQKSESSSYSPEAKIKATIKGGIPGIINGDVEGTLDLKKQLEKEINTSEASKAVIEKIYHDNLLDNLIQYIENNENVVNVVENIVYGKYVKISIPFDFVNHDYLKSISNEQFKKSFEKIMNATGNKDEKSLKETKFAIELIGNFDKFGESCFPTKQLIIRDNIIIPLDNKYLREAPEMIDFKYGGNITVVGKVTKDCSDKRNAFGLYNEKFGKALEDVKKSMYNIFLPNYDKSVIITPIALYFE